MCKPFAGRGWAEKVEPKVEPRDKKVISSITLRISSSPEAQHFEGGGRVTSNGNEALEGVAYAPIACQQRVFPHDGPRLRPVVVPTIACQ